MNLFEDGGAIAGIRPERIRLSPEGALRGRVVRRESTGADAFLEVETANGRLAVRVAAEEPARAGDLVALELPGDAMRRFDPRTGLAVA